MERIELKELFDIVWNRKIQIIIIVLIFTILGSLYSFFLTTPMYDSYTSLVLVKVGTEQSDTTIDQTDISLNQNLVSTYSELIKSNNIIEQVKLNLNINYSTEQLRDNIIVSSVKNTEMIVITIQDESAYNAKIIADEIAEVFTAKVKEIYNINNVYIVDKAQISEEPYNINHIRDIIVSVLFGMIAAVLYTIISNYLDNTIKSENDVEKYTKLEVVGALPEFTVKKKEQGEIGDNNELITRQTDNKQMFENFKTIRTNIQFINNYKTPKTILLTSTVASEGKSYITANLAVTFAQTKKKVLIVDADMRRGRQNRIFVTDNQMGLSNYLFDVNNENSLDNYIKSTPIDNLYLLTSGIIPYNPSELLNSEKMQELIERLKTKFDIIIFDGTPNTIVTDSVILSRLVDCNIIVSCYRLTKIEDLKKVKKDIENVGGKISGAILNKLPMKQHKYYY